MTTSATRSVAAIGAILIALVWLLIARGTTDRSSVQPGDVAALPTATPPAAAAAPGREAVDAAVIADATPPPIVDAPFVVASYRLRAQVIDEHGDGIADAEVRTWEARVRPVPPGLLSELGDTSTRRRYSGRKNPDSPLARTRTDATGICELRVDHEMVFVSARTPDLESPDHAVWHERYRPGTTLTIVLEPPLFVRGVVLRADDTPAPGVDVRLTVQGGSELARGEAGQRDPVQTDVDGRFAFPINRYHIYGVLANDGDVRTFPVRVSMTTRFEDREIVVRFPGALSVRGVLRDAAGHPCAGTVQLWEEPDSASDPDSPFRAMVESSTDGRFSIDVPRHARCLLVGSAEGHASTPAASTEVSPATPHAEVALRLERTAVIAGVVGHESGEPAAGVSMYLQPESGDSRNSHAPTQEDLFARVKPVHADAAGRFRFEGVHPRTTWTLVCVPDAAQRLVAVRRRGIRPGTEDVDMRLTDAEVRGAVLRGKVFDAAGQPTDAYSLTLVSYRDGEADTLREVTDAAIANGRFALPPISLGRTVGVTIAPRNYAPVLLGPIETGPDHPEFVVHLRAFAEVACRVLHADGRPARRLHVVALEKSRVPLNLHHSPPQTDDEGIARFERRTPGAYEFSIYEGPDKLASAEVELTPGRNPEVVLRLAE